MMFNRFDLFKEESSTSFTGNIAWDAWNIEEESSASSQRMMFDRLDPFEEESSASLLRIVFLICLIR